MTTLDAHATLARLEPGADLEEVLGFYDTLAPVPVTDMIGAWRGSGITTGSPFDGLLENVGWHGKRFDSADDGHPLIFTAGPRRLVSIDPGRMPIGLAAQHGQRFVGSTTRLVFRMLRPLLTTRRPRARLRQMRYREVVTAAMSYDQLPIIDVFRAVDADTLVGAMDMRGLAQPYLFVLRRET